MKYTTQDFNLPKIKTLYKVLNGIAVVGLLLWLAAILLLPALRTPLMMVVYLVNLIGIVIWVVLWKELQKSGASIVMHAIFAALLGVTGIMGLLFIMIALSQAKTVLNCNGNVDVTFWNIKKSA